MKRITLLLFSIIILAGCERPSVNNDSIDNENTEETLSVKLYHITDDITPFESVFLAEDGNCLAIKKDTTFGYVAVIDSLKADDEKALVVYIDSLGKVRRVFNDGKSLDISYNSAGNVNLWYREVDGTSEVFNDIKYTSTQTITKSSTKAGDVFDPMDIASIGLVLWDLRDIGDAVAFNPLIGDVLKANIAANLLTTGPFSNTTTEILTGITSVAITAAIGTSSLPIAVLLATIGVVDAAISDWQNSVADKYFGTATPLTGDAIQLTDNHFVISYSLNGINPNQTDFNIGVIIADGLFVTKNHHLLKKSVPFDSKDGKIIINLKGLDKKKGDKLKYRIYLEPADDNGFKWDDQLLDYWRYGQVNEFVIDEPALRIESAIQTDGTVDETKSIYTFDVDVTISNEIPFEFEEWGVGIYSTQSDMCDSDSQLHDIISLEHSYKETLPFSINVNHLWMNTVEYPHLPIMNYFAVPYLSFDEHTYALYDSAIKIDLSYVNNNREDGNEDDGVEDDDNKWGDSEGDNDEDDDNKWDDVEGDNDEDDDNKWSDGEGDDDDDDNKWDGIYRLTIIGSKNIPISVSYEIQVTHGSCEPISKDVVVKEETLELGYGLISHYEESKWWYIRCSEGEFSVDLNHLIMDRIYSVGGDGVLKFSSLKEHHYFAYFDFPATSGTYSPYEAGYTYIDYTKNDIVETIALPSGSATVQLEKIQ